MEKIILVGFGGHAKSVIDTIENSGCCEIMGVIEKDKRDQLSYRGYSVIGDDDDLELSSIRSIENAFVTIGYMGHGTRRQQLYNKLIRNGYKLPNIIDRTAIIAQDAIIGAGSFVGKGAIINADAIVGKMCIINTRAILEHECFVGDYSHIAVGATLCGNVNIGKGVFIGAGATIIQGIKIGDSAIIGAGTTVVKDIPEYTMVYGATWKKIGEEIYE